MRKLARSRAGQPFAEPVLEEQVPGYHAAVDNPMDLGNVAARLEAGDYGSLGADLSLCCLMASGFQFERNWGTSRAVGHATKFALMAAPLCFAIGGDSLD